MEQELVVNEVRITDPKALEDVKRALLTIKPKIASAVVNGVRITDPKALEDVERALLIETERTTMPKIASAVEAILKKADITLNGRKVLITTGDKELKAEFSGGGGVGNHGRYPSNTPKPTRMYDPEGQPHEFLSNHAAFMWVTSTRKVDCDRGIKHNYMGVLEKLGVVEAKGLIDGRDTYKIR